MKKLLTLSLLLSIGSTKSVVYSSIYEEMQHRIKENQNTKLTGKINDGNVRYDILDHDICPIHDVIEHRISLRSPVKTWCFTKGYIVQYIYLQEQHQEDGKSKFNDDAKGFVTYHSFFKYHWNHDIKPYINRR